MFFVKFIIYTYIIYRIVSLIIMKRILKVLDANCFSYIHSTYSDVTLKTPVSALSEKLSDDEPDKYLDG